MATVYPTAAGAWSTRTWNNDATGAAYGMAPQTGDTVLSNNLSITIDQDVTVVLLKNKAGTTAAAGGTFINSGSRTVNANTEAGATTCLTLGAGCTQNGNSLGGTATNAVGSSLSAGAVQNGNSTGGSASGANGTSLQTSAIQNGNSTGGSASSAYGTSIATNAAQNGNSTAGSASGAHGTFSQSCGVQNGNSSAGSTANAFGTSLQFGGVQNGNSTGGSAATAYGTSVQGGAVLYGSQTGGSHATAYGALCQSGGLTVTTGVTSNTGSGLTLGNDGAVVLQNGVTSGQLNITGTRYSVGISLTNYPFIGSGGITQQQVNHIKHMIRSGAIL